MLEVCVDTIQAAILAEESGAERIELCSALELGGVTPSGPLISAIRRTLRVPLIVLIRVRAGDFVFDPVDCEVMLEQAQQAIALGANGIAIGGLTGSRTLHLDFLSSVARALPACERVMHRAFDQVAEPAVALETLVQLGFTRILTSGGSDRATEGTAKLRELHSQARGRIEILPAGGISPANALQILKESGTNQLHASFRNGPVPFRTAIAQTRSILRARFPTD